MSSRLGSLSPSAKRLVSFKKSEIRFKKIITLLIYLNRKRKSKSKEIHSFKDILKKRKSIKKQYDIII